MTAYAIFLYLERRLLDITFDLRNMAVGTNLVVLAGDGT